MRSSRPSVHEWIALGILRLAKLRSSRFGVENDSCFYEQFFTERHLEAYASDIRQQLRREEIGKFMRQVNTGSLILDVGCGIGAVVQAIDPGVRWVGCEFSLRSLSLVRQTARAGACFVQGSALDLPFRRESVDVVLCLEVVEHLEDDSRAVGEVARVLRPGGWLVASVPSEYYFPRYRELMGHWRHYSRASLSDLLARAGIRVVRYLNNFPRFHRRYFYLYLLFVALNACLNMVGRSKRSIYCRQIPFTGQPVYEALRPWLLRLARRDRRLDLDHLSSSTFVVGRKEPILDEVQGHR